MLNLVVHIVTTGLKKDLLNCYVYRRLNTGFEARLLEGLADVVKRLGPGPIPG